MIKKILESLLGDQLVFVWSQKNNYHKFKKKTTIIAINLKLEHTLFIFEEMNFYKQK